MSDEFENDEAPSNEELGITPAMIEAGVSAWEVWADSLPRILVEQVLRASFLARDSQKSH